MVTVFLCSDGSNESMTSSWLSAGKMYRRDIGSGSNGKGFALSPLLHPDNNVRASKQRGRRAIAGLRRDIISFFPARQILGVPV